MKNHDVRARPPAPDAVAVWISAASLLIFVAGRCLVPMDETDLFYNLRLGEIILGTGSVPRTNLLSFTYPDFPDPNLAWLFQILVALAYRAAAIPGTVVLKTVFVVATFALLFRVALRRGAHPAVAAATLALAAWAAEPRFVERPHLVTFAGLGLLLLALERAESGRPRLLRAMIPLGVLWANGNSCFFFAPAILLLYVVGGALDSAGDRALRSAVRRAGWVAVALVPVLFATPSGTGWFGYVVNHFRMPTLRPLQEYRVAEWPTDAPFLFLMLAVTITTIWSPRRARSPIDDDSRSSSTMRNVLPIVALALLGARRIRFVAEFSLLAGPYVAARATTLAQGIFFRAENTPRSSRLLALLIALPLLLVWTFFPRAQSLAGGGRFFDLGIEDGLVPVAAVRWLDQHDLRDHLYNDLEVGSYLAWDGWPRHRVFQDPRINGYPAGMHAILRRQDLPRPDWEALMTRFDVQAALVTYPELNPRAALFDPLLWALCYRTPEALVFARRTASHASLIGAEEIPLTFRFDPSTGNTAVVLVHPPPSSPVRTCEWNRRLADLSVARGDLPQASMHYAAALSEGIDCLPPAVRDTAREQAASVQLRLGNPARAVDLLGGLASTAARSNRAFALLQLGHPEQALSLFDELLPQIPADPEIHFGRALALCKLDRPQQAVGALRGFIDRWPQHFAAPRARSMLQELTGARPR